jgi:hypothetical protein
MFFFYLLQFDVSQNIKNNIIRDSIHLTSICGVKRIQKNKNKTEISFLHQVSSRLCSSQMTFHCCLYTMFVFFICCHSLFIFFWCIIYETIRLNWICLFFFFFAYVVLCFYSLNRDSTAHDCFKNKQNTGKKK